MIFGLIIGILIGIGFFILFYLAGELMKPKLSNLEETKPEGKKTEKFQLRKIDSISDGCPICGSTLVYSDDNIQLRPQAFFKKYYCVQCKMNTAIILQEDRWII